MPLGFLPEAAVDAMLDYFQRPASAKSSFIAWLKKRQNVETLMALPPGDRWTDDQPIISAARAHGCFVPRAISAFDVAASYPWAASQAINVAEKAAHSAVIDERLPDLYDEHIEAALAACGFPHRLNNLPEESWVAPDGVIWREVNYNGLDYVLTSDGRVYFGVLSRGMELRTADTPFYTSPPPELDKLLADLAERANAKPPADKRRRQTFIERAVADPSILDTLNDEIDAWHSESLDAYLGMSPDEYDEWVREPMAIHSIIDKRRAARESREHHRLGMDRVSGFASTIAASGMQSLGVSKAMPGIAALAEEAQKRAVDVIRQAARDGFRGTVSVDGNTGVVTFDDGQTRTTFPNGGPTGPAHPTYDDVVDIPSPDSRPWQIEMDAHGNVSVWTPERSQPRWDGEIAPPPPQPDEETP